MTNEEYVAKLRAIIWSACGGIGIANLLINCIILFVALAIVINSIKEEIARSKCKCGGETNVNEARNIIINNDPKAQAIRDILIKRGEIDDDLPRVTRREERAVGPKVGEAGYDHLQQRSNYSGSK